MSDAVPQPLDHGRLDEAKAHIEVAVAVDLANLTAQGLRHAIDS